MRYAQFFERSRFDRAELLAHAHGTRIVAAGCPGAGRALGCKEVELAGPIRPHDRLVTHSLSVARLARLKESGAAMALADATVAVDGEVIDTIRSAKVGMFLGIKYPDDPLPSRHARGGRMGTRRGNEP